MNQFNNATQLKCLGGVCTPVNPYETFSGLGTTAHYRDFETWLSQQPPLHCDESLNGVFPVEEFGEVELQRWMEFENVWVKAIKNKPGYKYRYWLNYLGPKKQEREAEYFYHGIHEYKGDKFPDYQGREILVWDDNSNPDAPCYQIQFVGSSELIGNIDYEDIDWIKPDTTEQKGVEQVRPHQWISIGIEMPRLNTWIVIWSLSFREEMIWYYQNEEELEDFKHWYPTLGEPN